MIPDYLDLHTPRNLEKNKTTGLSSFQILSFVASKLGEAITAPVVSEIANELVGRLSMLNLTVLNIDQLNHFYNNMYSTDLGQMGLESSAKYEILKRLITFSNSL